MVRNMTIADYEEVYALWMTIKGFAMRSVDDSKEGVARFLDRNPKTSVVAIEDNKVVGAILCGHDGRRGCMYHVCVHPDYRPLLEEYLAMGIKGHTPQNLKCCFAFHEELAASGDMHNVDWNKYK